MILDLLRDAVHGLHSRRGSTFAAVGGLALAMAASLVVTIIAIALTAPDPAIPDPERVVLLDMKGNPPGMPSAWFTASPVFFATSLKERQAPLDLISRVSVHDVDISIDGRPHAVSLLIADPDVVPLFGLQAHHGDLRRALTQQDGMVITTDLMRLLWGDVQPEAAIGRRVEGKRRVYTVSAVIPNIDPRSPLWDQHARWSESDAVAMVGFDTAANPMSDEHREGIFMINGRVFARLRDGVSVSEIGRWMRDAFKAYPQYAQLPLEWRDGREAAFFRGITLTALPFNGAANELRWQLVRAVAGASALLLLMAAFNCMNLQTATLLQRQRETALRRSLGADGRQLLMLWGTEVWLLLILAAVAAMLIAWWIAPVVANWVGLAPDHPVTDSMPAVALAGLFITILVIFLMTLVLPASIALRQPAAPALQGRTASEGPWGKRVRQGLLALQLGGVVLLLSLGGVLAMQQHHLLNADRGFATHNRLWLGLVGEDSSSRNLDALAAALDRHPAITHWAFNDMRPARDTQGGLQMHVSSSEQKQVLRVSTVSPTFFATYGMTLLAGRPIAASGESNIVIDAKAARALGFATPQSAIGEIVRAGSGFLQEGNSPRRIVGVVKDVRLESARDPALPQAFILTNEAQSSLSAFGPDVHLLRRTLEDLWRAYGTPLVRYEIESADDQRASIYQQEQHLTTMLICVALLAVGVAMLGAYTLVADALRRRRTELVLRRLHGAGHAAIVRELAAEFAPPFVVAIVLGLPVAFVLGERYLAGFVDRVAVASGVVLPMCLAAIATLVVTVLATMQHMRRALALQAIEAMK